MWQEAIMARLRYCFRIHLQVLTNPTKTLRQMGFARFQPETSHVIQAPDCSMKYTTPLHTPNPISTIFITVVIANQDYTDADRYYINQVK